MQIDGVEILTTAIGVITAQNPGAPPAGLGSSDAAMGALISAAQSEGSSGAGGGVVSATGRVVKGGGRGIDVNALVQQVLRESHPPPISSPSAR